MMRALTGRRAQARECEARITAIHEALEFITGWSPPGDVYSPVTTERHVVDGQRWTFARAAGAPPMEAADAAAAARALESARSIP